MKILEFRRMVTEDICYREFGNWSRCYEYAYVLNVLKQVEANSHPSIHNTCSGSGGIHLDFAVSMQAISNNVVHSDRRNYRDAFDDIQTPNSFIMYDILKTMNRKFDFIVCVSSLEDLYVEFGPEGARQAFANLLDQVKDGGRLLITCDYPTIPIEFLEDLLGQKIQDPKDKIVVSGATSSYYHEGVLDYNIILIDIEK